MSCQSSPVFDVFDEAVSVLLCEPLDEVDDGTHGDDFESVWQDLMYEMNLIETEAETLKRILQEEPSPEDEQFRRYYLLAHSGRSNEQNKVASPLASQHCAPSAPKTSSGNAKLNPLPVVDLSSMFLYMERF